MAHFSSAHGTDNSKWPAIKKEASKGLKDGADWRGDMNVNVLAPVTLSVGPLPQKSV